jgi:predicted metal-dependent phosphoesterase TrpH
MMWVDGVETYNAGTSKQKNDLAKELAKKYKKFEAGGSDSHFLAEVGNGATRVFCTSLNVSNIKKALATGKTDAVKFATNNYKKKIISRLVRAVKERDVRVLVKLAIKLPMRILAK